METVTTKFKVGDHISDYGSSYWGRLTGVITEIVGVCQRRGKSDVFYRYINDLTGTEQSAFESDLKKCRSVINEKTVTDRLTEIH